MSLWPFNRRNPFTASRTAAAVHRSTIWPTAPPLDVPLHMARAADQTLDRVGRGERLTEAIGEAEREDGEGFVEAFTHAHRGTRIPVVESSCQILQETTSGGDIDLLVGARDDRVGPWPLAFREMLQDVSELVHLAAMNQARGSKRLCHRFMQRLRAIEDDQQAAVGAQPAALQVGEEALTHRTILANKQSATGSVVPFRR
jgi:hypothetical protein